MKYKNLKYILSLFAIILCTSCNGSKNKGTKLTEKDRQEQLVQEATACTYEMFYKRNSLNELNSFINSDFDSYEFVVTVKNDTVKECSVYAYHYQSGKIYNVEKCENYENWIIDQNINCEYDISNGSFSFRIEVPKIYFMLKYGISSKLLKKLPANFGLLHKTMT